MIATLVLAAAHMTAPATESVNFVHGYKPDYKTSYELTIEIEAQGLEIIGAFDLTIKSELKNGKMEASFLYTELDVMGQDMAADLGAFDFDLDKYGVPTVVEEDDVYIFAFVALLSTFLPATTLDVGDEFKIKLSEEAFGFKGRGTFEGMKKVDGVSLAVLKCKGSMYIDDEDIDVTIESYYDPATKRIVSGEVVADTSDDTYTIKTKLKK